jgi:uncharacterized protein (TIGR00251 family)
MELRAEFCKKLYNEKRMARCIHVSGNLVYIYLKVLPGTSKSQILDIQEDRLRVKIAAAPEHGKANTELCSFLAKLLGCPKKAVCLASGEKSRLKTLTVPRSFQAKLEELIEG